MKKQLIALFTLCCCMQAFAQFEGSFSMILTSSGNEKLKEPIEMKFTVKDNLAIMESSAIPKGGATGKMLLNSSDQSTTMLMENGDKKMGLKMYARSLTQDSLVKLAQAKNPKITRTGKTKMIEGYKCEQVLMEDDDSNVDAWITDALGFNPIDFMGAVKGSDKDYSVEKLYKGWMKNGVSMETTIAKKDKSSVITMQLKNIKKETVSASLFSTDGYQIMDMSQMGRGMFPSPETK